VVAASRRIREGLSGKKEDAVMIAIPNKGPSTFGAADWLSLAASPTFALMALATRVFGAEAPAMICSMSHAAAMGGMVPMYVLMSVFHSVPWLKLAAKRLEGTRGL
jgi:hypothetical protein